MSCGVSLNFESRYIDVAIWLADPGLFINFVKPASNAVQGEERLRKQVESKQCRRVWHGQNHLSVCASTLGTLHGQTGFVHAILTLLTDPALLPEPPFGGEGAYYDYVNQPVVP